MLLLLLMMLLLLLLLCCCWWCYCYCCCFAVIVDAVAINVLAVVDAAAVVVVTDVVAVALPAFRNKSLKHNEPIVDPKTLSWRRPTFFFPKSVFFKNRCQFSIERDNVGRGKIVIWTFLFCFSQSDQVHLHGPHQSQLLRAGLWHLLRCKEIHVACSGWRMHQVPLEGLVSSQCLPGLRIRQALRWARSHGQKPSGIANCKRCKPLD